MSPEADWKLIRAFLAVMKTGNLTRAAAELGTTQPTVGRQIRELERLSGEVYFLRKGTRLEPTERARAMYARARDLEAAVTGLARDLARRDEPEAATVRISASAIFGVELLPRLLPDLMAQTPGASFELHATDEVHDLVRRDADIAIRLTTPKEGDLIARRVGDVTVGLYAAKVYLDRRGRPKSAIDLAPHTLLAGRTGDDVRSVAEANGIRLTAENLAIRTDSLLVRLAALRAGVGIGPCHTWLGESEPGLERIFPQLDVATLPLWLVAHEDVRRSRSLRQAFDALHAALSVRFAPSRESPTVRA